MIILQALYFFLPAYLANMAPVFVSAILKHRLAHPLDFNKRFNGKPILGKNKTWRGLCAGVLMGVLVVYIQQCLLKYEFFASISIIDYRDSHIYLFGAVMGAGALIGDALKSFMKRQKGIESGQKWPVFDQLDFVIGGLVAIYIVSPVSHLAMNLQPLHVLALLLITPLLHVLTNKIGYFLHLKSVPW